MTGGARADVLTTQHAAAEPQGPVLVTPYAKAPAPVGPRSSAG